MLHPIPAQRPPLQRRAAASTIRPRPAAGPSFATNRWDFVVVTDRDQLTQLAKVFQSAGHVAPVGGHHRPHRGQPLNHSRLVHYDLGQAMHGDDADPGAAPATPPSAIRTSPAEPLDIPPHWFVAYLIALGYPADQPLTLIRRSGRRMSVRGWSAG